MFIIGVGVVLLTQFAWSMATKVVVLARVTTAVSVSVSATVSVHIRIHVSPVSVADYCSTMYCCIGAKMYFVLF